MNKAKQSYQRQNLELYLVNSNILKSLLIYKITSYVMLLHNNCFSVFRSLEFAFLCLKMLENTSLRVKNNTLKSLCFKSPPLFLSPPLIFRPNIETALPRPPLPQGLDDRAQQDPSGYWQVTGSDLGQIISF